MTMISMPRNLLCSILVILVGNCFSWYMNILVFLMCSLMRSFEEGRNREQAEVYFFYVKYSRQWVLLIYLIVKVN
jgi:hypothetical protein